MYGIGYKVKNVHVTYTLHTRREHAWTMVHITTTVIVLPSLRKRTYASLVPSMKQKTADVEKMANSIHRDISDYGDLDLENQTDDLELIISL